MSRHIYTIVRDGIVIGPLQREREPIVKQLKTMTDDCIIETWLQPTSDWVTTSPTTNELLQYMAETTQRISTKDFIEGNYKLYNENHTWEDWYNGFIVFVNGSVEHNIT